MSRDDLLPVLGRPARVVGNIPPVSLGAEKMGPVGDVEAIIHGQLFDERRLASTAKQNEHLLSNVVFIGQADVAMLLESIELAFPPGLQDILKSYVQPSL